MTSKQNTPTVAIVDHIETALEKFEAGFTSKAAQKSALENVNHAFEAATKEIQELYLRGERTSAGQELYWALPHYPHQWAAKHAKMTLAVYPQAGSIVETISEIVALRNAIKAAPINKPTSKINEFEVATTARVMKSLKEMMELRGSQYARGLRLQEIFGDLPVYANTHVVVNQHNTQFLRTFWYVGGELTPLNVIIAVLQEKAEG